MTPELAVEILRAAMTEAVGIATPILGTAMAIGLSISLTQTVTSIQEQTLTFVPKALAVVGLLMTILPWIVRKLMDFTIAVIQRMPDMVR